MKAINTVENFKYRIKDDKILIHNVIHASATILRSDKTFGFSFIPFLEDFTVFNQNFLSEKKEFLAVQIYFHQQIQKIVCTVLQYLG